jgi:acetyl-CoA synthetase
VSDSPSTPSAGASAIAQLCAAAASDPDAFWTAEADRLPWFKRWESVLELDPPSFRWFRGAQTNLCHDALDYQVGIGRGDHPALICLDERGERRVLTYAQLLTEVQRVAAALRGLGVGKGDRVTITMPTCQEAIVAMLAVVRIGAIHSVVFAGFGHTALGDRIRASGSRVVLTADVTFRKGTEVALKHIVDEALAAEPSAVEWVVVLERGSVGTRLERPRDLTWPEFLARGEGRSNGYTVMEANEPAFILATSGTTARPKLAVHTHGGYRVHIHAMGRWVFGLSRDDVWWSTSDIGWIVGHSYIVYAPLMAGATTIAYEGALDFPGPDVFWRLCAQEGVTGVFTSPTAVRMLMRYGESHVAGHDLTALKRVFCAGEVLNPPAWEWLQQTVLQDRVPVLDHMWQTETGGPIFANPWGVGMLPIKPGSGGVPMPGVDAVILTPEGSPVATGEKGIMAIRRPFPGLTASLWGEPERYGTDYWSRIPGVYATGDAAWFDADGYAWFAGRADEIIKIAAHRLGTIEVETAFLRHPAVAEAGVTGRPDDLRGEVIAAFVVLKHGRQPTEGLRRDLLATVREELGALAVIGDLSFVPMLPKTRSGKIMRRLLKAQIMGQPLGDTSTLEE